MTDELTIHCTFGGTNQDWATLAGMVGTRAGTMEIDGMKGHVPAFVRRERGDPFQHADMGPISGHTVCPTAYALARHAGYDPAAIMLLQTVECEVTVELPGWPDRLDITRGDSGDDVCGPVAPGMMWAQDPMDDEPKIRVITSHTGLPESILGLLPERMAGLPLRDLVSHPVLDRLDLTVKAVSELPDGITWVIDIDGAPGAVTLREAARLYEDTL